VKHNLNLIIKCNSDTLENEQTAQESSVAAEAPLTSQPIPSANAINGVIATTEESAATTSTQEAVKSTPAQENAVSISTPLNELSTHYSSQQSASTAAATTAEKIQPPISTPADMQSTGGGATQPDVNSITSSAVSMTTSSSTTQRTVDPNNFVS
jgi:hypothetical protein